MVSSGPRNRSQAMARASTMPPAPPSPCAKRRAIKLLPVLAAAQQMEASVKKISAMNRGLRRPVESEMGPTNNCPRAMPSRQAVMVNWVVAVEILRSAARAGRLGR